MNILKFELRHLLINIIMMGTSIAFFSMLYVFIYPSLGEEFQIFADALPPEVVNGLGLQDLITFEGYYRSISINLLLISSIFALYIGLKVIQHDIRESAFEFLITKPIDKKKLFAFKYISGCIAVFLGMILWMSCTLAICYILSIEFEFTSIVSIFSGMLMTTILLYSLGVFIGAIRKYIRYVGATAIFLGLLFFQWDILIKVLDKDVLKFTSIVSLFYSSNGEDISGLHICIGIVCIAFLYGAANFVYTRKSVC